MKQLPMCRVYKRNFGELVLHLLNPITHLKKKKKEERKDGLRREGKIAKGLCGDGSCFESGQW